MSGVSGDFAGLTKLSRLGTRDSVTIDFQWQSIVQVILIIRGVLKYRYRSKGLIQSIGSNHLDHWLFSC